MVESVARAADRMIPPTMAIHLIAWSDWWGGEREIRRLCCLVPRDRIAVDVGAAEGTYSYFLARYAVACYAFEANSRSASILRARLPHVRVHACALSDCDGETELRIPIVDGLALAGWATVETANHFSALGSPKVQTRHVAARTLKLVLSSQSRLHEDQRGRSRERRPGRRV